MFLVCVCVCVCACVCVRACVRERTREVVSVLPLNATGPEFKPYYWRILFSLLSQSALKAVAAEKRYKYADCEIQLKL